MSSFDRKMRRRHRASFVKKFKEKMREFKKIVSCSTCGRTPTPGQTIDSWKMTKTGENIALVCESCLESKKEGTTNEER